jgi:hypothetical protein
MWQIADGGGIEPTECSSQFEHATHRTARQAVPNAHGKDAVEKVMVAGCRFEHGIVPKIVCGSVCRFSPFQTTHDVRRSLPKKVSGSNANQG